MPRTVEIGPGQTQVQLPDGFAYATGEVVELEDEQFEDLSATALSTGVVLDRGEHDEVLAEHPALVQANIPIELADIETTGWAGKTFTPGFAGSLVAWDVVVITPATTAAIVSLDVDVAGGVAASTLALTEVNLAAVGDQVAEANIDTAFTDAEDINITASDTTTPFTEGMVVARLLLTQT